MYVRTSRLDSNFSSQKRDEFFDLPPSVLQAYSVLCFAVSNSPSGNKQSVCPAIVFIFLKSRNKKSSSNATERNATQRNHARGYISVKCILVLVCTHNNSTTTTTAQRHTILCLFFSFLISRYG